MTIALILISECSEKKITMRLNIYLNNNSQKISDQYMYMYILIIYTVYVSLLESEQLPGGHNPWEQLDDKSDP